MSNMNQLPEGAREEDRVLRNDRHSRPDRVQVNVADVQSVNQDAPTRDVIETEEAESDGRLAASCPTSHANLGSNSH